MRNSWWSRPWTLVELFVLVNLGSLAFDVYIAHSINAFERPAEWIPVIFSVAAPVLLLAAILLGGLTAGAREAVHRVAPLPARLRTARLINYVVGAASLSVGVAGMLLHLQSHFFEAESVKNLVYTAPFAAPLAYAGLGLLLIMDRMVDGESPEWAQWVLFFTLGGFFGNFVLSLADHAQNGFFNVFEWIPVGASAFAVGFLFLAVLRPYDGSLLKATSWVMVLQVLVGVTGFALHLQSNMARPGESVWDRFLYGAPIFAPLLFANIAVLGGLGLWAMFRSAPVPAEARPMRPTE